MNRRLFINFFSNFFYNLKNYSNILIVLLFILVQSFFKLKLKVFLALFENKLQIMN